MITPNISHIASKKTKPRKDNEFKTKSKGNIGKYNNKVSLEQKCKVVNGLYNTSYYNYYYFLLGYN